MKSSYLEYLNTLSKEELIAKLYTPFKKYLEYPAISRRTVALRLSYDGRGYQGVQMHENIKNISDCLKNALHLTEIGREFVFCGRTDAGVSAINMIVSADVNSRLADPNRSFALCDSDYNEYPYDVILNRSLPEDIRVTGWAPAPDSFNARYDCIQRHYNYFFVLNDLDLDAMNKASEEISKFTNFYSLSTHSNPKAIYERKLDEISIKKVVNLTHIGPMCDINKQISNIDLQDDSALYKSKQEKIKSGQNKFKNRIFDSCSEVYCLDIKASGFLHNMVRKIFWVIRNCGKGKAFTLKNVEIAEPEPLVFVGAKFKEKLNFMGNKYNDLQFKQEKDKAAVQYAIAKLRHELFDR